jgi:hypothetical protein
MVPVQGGQVSLPKVPYWLLTLLLQQGAVQEAADTGGQPHMLMEELGVLIGAGSGKILCSMGRRISGKIVWHDLRCRDSS